MTTESEMTLHEWVGILHEKHLARREFVAMEERIAALELENAQAKHTIAEQQARIAVLEKVADKVFQLHGTSLFLWNAEEHKEVGELLDAAGYKYGEGNE